MSEPTQWGPPPAPRPTAPYPTAPRPVGHRPAGPPPASQDRTAFLPTAPIPTVRAEIPRSQAPRSRPADDDYEDDYSSGRPRRRGQVFSGLVLLMALAVSALTYYLTYQTLASIRITSGDSLGGAGGQAMSLGTVLFGALVVFVLAVIALAIARPKALAGLGLAASLLLPVAALVMGVWYGGSVLRQNVESEIAQAGPEVAAQGAAAVADAVVKELESRGIDAGPVRDLIRSAVGS
jgi:hypothetical protein